MIGRKLSIRKLLVIVHDLIATAAAILASFYIRFEEPGLVDRFHVLRFLLPAFTAYAGVVYSIFHLYESKWRFASLPDLMNIARASAVLAITLLMLDYIVVAPNVYGQFFFGKVTIVLYFLLQMMFLGGPRIAYRYYRYTRTARHQGRDDNAGPALVLGRAADAEVLLRAIESGAVSKIKPVGILSPSLADQGQTMRGVPVLGTLEELESVVSDRAQRSILVKRVVFTPSALIEEVKPEAILTKARRLGLTVHRLPSLEGGEIPRLAPVNVEDLLLRPSTRIDYPRLERFLQGRSVAVTGGGGSIGAEICERVVAFGADKLLIIENSEPALHAVMEALAAKVSRPDIVTRICDVRDRKQLFRLFEQFRPDLVFHAAALKHVPLLEDNWAEGIKTNVFGTVNVADAAITTGASAMVMISTDKAVEPISILGATKRFAEMYCQGRDADLAQQRHDDDAQTRLIAVRFGNVLASNGSVVPKFKAQIDAGGPVTVTHQDMVRYFMTIREACDLVLTASCHAIGQPRNDMSVYVLNMGQPVKIVDLAERMIRLSGLEPGRDIDIVFTGVRPGERLQEILFAREEPTLEIGIPGVVAARPVQPPLDLIRQWLGRLEHALAANDREAIYGTLRDAVPDFRGVAEDAEPVASIKTIESCRVEGAPVQLNRGTELTFDLDSGR